MPLSVCNRVMEDKLLIWKFKRGNREALRRIYDKYHADLLKIAVVLTGGMNPAEDVVQDVFVRFAERAGRLTLSGSLRNYLITSTTIEITKTCSIYFTSTYSTLHFIISLKIVKLIYFFISNIHSKTPSIALVCLEQATEIASFNSLKLL